MFGGGEKADLCFCCWGMGGKGGRIRVKGGDGEWKGLLKVELVERSGTERSGTERREW